MILKKMLDCDDFGACRWILMILKKMLDLMILKKMLGFDDFEEDA